jgi:hypothetical protein
MALQLIKQHLGLHLLWSAKPTVILQQVWAVLIIAQILQALRLEIAGKAAVDPFEVSLPLLVAYAPRLLADGIDPVTFFVAHGRQAGFIRPSRRTQMRAPALPGHLINLPPLTSNSNEHLAMPDASTTANLYSHPMALSISWNQ